MHRTHESIARSYSRYWNSYLVVLLLYTGLLILCSFIKNLHNHFRSSLVWLFPSYQIKSHFVFLPLLMLFLSTLKFHHLLRKAQIKITHSGKLFRTIWVFNDPSLVVNFFKTALLVGRHRQFFMYYQLLFMFNIANIVCVVILQYCDGWHAFLSSLLISSFIVYSTDLD